MRVLLLAPFERARGQGGSQRATAIAERLEDRGIELGWQVVRRRHTSRADKLRAMTRSQPALIGLYEPPTELAAGDWDAALVAHSYLVPTLRRVLGNLPIVVDFHNLEWRHLADGARTQAASGLSALTREVYVRGQVALMRRVERSIVRSSDLSLFVSDAERLWAMQAVPSGSTLLARSVLPRSEEQAAATIHSARAPQPGNMVYVGTLTFPTNLGSLERFLSVHWPPMRAAVPGLRLTVAGACAESDRLRLERHPGVQALGFVEDLRPILAGCTAVVMPFDGVAGTSLRALFYGLAGLTVIGSEHAFRGIEFPIGLVARSPSEWARATAQIAATTPASTMTTAAVREQALARQHDPTPWDQLAETLATLASERRGNYQDFTRSA